MKARGNSWNKTRMIMIVSMIIGFTSCLDFDKYDFKNISDEIEISPQIALPLAHGSLSLDNILNELDSTSFIQQDVDSLLYIIYSANLFSQDVSELFNIPDQNFTPYTISIPNLSEDIFLPGVGDTISTITVTGFGDFSLNFNPNLEFAFDNEQVIDSMHLDNLSMRIDVQSTFQHDLILVLSSDSILVDGKSFNTTFYISSGSPNAGLDEILTNTTLYIDNSDPDFALLPLKIDLSIINNGGAIRTTDKCDISMSFKNNRFSSLYGYLGKTDVFDYLDTIDVSIFDRSRGGSLSFLNPSLSLLIENSFGIPLQIDLAEFEAISSINHMVTPVTFNENPFEMNYPEIQSEISYDTISITRDNSDFFDALDTSPKYLKFKAIARTNASNSGEIRNFITKNSAMSLGVELVLPLAVKAQGFSMEDTMSINFEDSFGSDIDKINNFRLNLVVDNGFPIETEIQVYFTDSSYNEVDVLFRNGAMALSPAENISTVVEYNALQLENLKKTKFAMFKASVNSPSSGDGYSRFYTYNKISFNLSVKVDFIINTNEL